MSWKTVAIVVGAFILLKKFQSGDVDIDLPGVKIGGENPYAGDDRFKTFVDQTKVLAPKIMPILNSNYAMKTPQKCIGLRCNA